MKYFTTIGDDETVYRFEAHGDDLVVHVGEGEAAETLRCSRSKIGDGAVFSLIVDGRSYDCLVEFDASDRNLCSVQVLGERVDVRVEDERERAASEVAAAKGGAAQTVVAAMPGVVVSVDVAAGDVVEAGTTLVVLDAMKMQNPIQAEAPGIVSTVHVSEGETVTGGQALVELRPPETAGDS